MIVMRRKNTYQVLSGGGGAEAFSARKVQTHFWRAPTMETRRPLIIENKIKVYFGQTIQPHLKNMLLSNQIRFAFLIHNFTCKKSPNGETSYFVHISYPVSLTINFEFPDGEKKNFIQYMY